MRILTTRLARIGAGAVAAVVVFLLLVLAAFPYGALKGVVERRLSSRFGRQVTITSLERVDSFGFAPTLAIRGLTIPQPAWAGTGDFARLAEGRATFSVWSLLIGRTSPHDIMLRGLRLALVRTRDGTTNWGPPGGGGSGGIADLSGTRVTDAALIYRDAKRDRQASVRVTIDPATGVRADGQGTVKGNPVTLTFRGPAARAGAAWPFTAAIDGPALSMHVHGTMDRPLAPDAMAFDVTARAADLKLIDAVIEAGLIGTQPVALTAHVRRDRPDWTVTGLTGTVGRSDIAGEVTVKARGGRHELVGRLTSRQLAFDDFASDEGRAKAAALRAAEGPKLVPDLRINLAKLVHTDGRIDFRVDRIVSYGKPSTLAAMRGTVILDHQRLTVDPFTLDLTTGAITGRATVDQHGQPAPTVTLDLTLAHSTIPALVGGHGSFTGQATAHAHLTGVGATIREAVGASDGAIGFVARDGILPAKLAAEFGFDAGRALFASDDKDAGLRCVVLRLDVRHGRGTLDPAMIVDTSQSQLRGQGTVTFPSEAMAIEVTGAPKQGSILRLPGSATIGGTIKEPTMTVAPGTASIGNIFKAIGRAIKGTQPPLASDADCAALATAALR